MPCDARVSPGDGVGVQSEVLASQADGLDLEQVVILCAGIGLRIRGTWELSEMHASPWQGSVHSTIRRAKRACGQRIRSCTRAYFVERVADTIPAQSLAWVVSRGVYSGVLVVALGS